MTDAEVLELSQSGFYQGEPLNGILIHTHISWVILTDNYAFKIKKPVEFSFLDFSNFHNRKFYCVREFELNRRLTDIYLAVLPIYRFESLMSIGCAFQGELLDYAVVMKRLDNTSEMDQVLLKGEVKLERIEKLAGIIADFHKAATSTFKAFDQKRFKRAFNNILTVKDWVRLKLGHEFEAIIEEAIVYSDDYLERHSGLFSKRIEDGFQRDVHGDLHTKNIFLTEEPVLFDCIEFNDEFRQIDLLSEVAFLCMDLEAYDRSDLSNFFMKQYLQNIPCIRNQKEWGLFAYYKLYRANVRAMVSAVQAKESRGNDQLEGEVKKYLCLMKAYLRGLK